MGAVIAATLASLSVAGAAPARGDLLWDDDDYVVLHPPNLVVLDEDLSYKRHVPIESVFFAGWGSTDWLPNGDLLLQTRALDAVDSAIMSRLSPARELTPIQRDIHGVGQFFDARTSPDGRQAFAVSERRLFRIDVDSGAILQELEPPLGGHFAGGMVTRLNPAAPGGAEVVVAEPPLGLIGYPLTADGDITDDGATLRGGNPFAQTLAYDAATDRILAQAYPGNTIHAFDPESGESAQDYVVPPGEGIDDELMHYQGVTVGADGTVAAIMMSGFEPDDVEALYVWDADGSSFRSIILDDLHPVFDDFDPPHFIAKGILWTGSSPKAVLEHQPQSLSSTLETGQTETHDLSVANPGNGPLEWTVCEEVAGLRRIGAITLESGEDLLSTAAIDPDGAFAYFGTSTSPARVIQVDLATFQRVGALALSDSESFVRTLVIGPDGAFAYVGTGTDRLVKLDLATFEPVGTLVLSGEPGSMVIDAAGELAYIGTDDFFASKVLKIDLATFTEVASIDLPQTEYHMRSAVIDPQGELAYFGAFTRPARVVQVDLTSFQRVGAVQTGDHLWTGLIDPAGEEAWFGGSGYPRGFLSRLDLDELQLSGTLTLAPGESVVRTAVMDPAGGHAYLGMATDPATVVKIDLATFDRLGAISLEGGESLIRAAVVDPAGDFAYFATGTLPGRVVKVGLNQPIETLPGWAAADPATGSIPAGGDQTVAVTFDAGGLAPDTYKATLCLRGNDPVTPRAAVSLTLNVNGTAKPVLTFEPTSLDFGGVEPGAGKTLAAMLTNTGSGAASELVFGALGDGFAADTSACGSTLPADSSCMVSVTFAPTVAGPAAATFTVGSAEGVAASLGLTGHGISETEVFSPAALEVDYAVLASDGNRVFEPGEGVDVAPSWRHEGLLEQTLGGSASGLTGPAGPSYEIVAADADYGLVFSGDTASCRDAGTCYQMDIGPVGVGRPATHWDASFEEALSDETAHTWTLHMGDSFVDVPPANLAYPFVETLLHAQVTSGCGDARYCPSGINVRAQMAVFMLKSKEGLGYLPPPCDPESQVFADVPFDSPFCPWIEELYDRGVLAGCGEDDYCPGDPIRRDQMAVILLKTLEGAGYVPSTCTGIFTDVGCPSLFADWIEDLHDRGITGGCGAEPSRFCPAAPVNRAQMAVFVTKTFGLTLYGP